MTDLFGNFYRGKRVLVTGHTGFKGSWLAIWLHEMGAEVTGIGLEPYSERDNFVLSGIGRKIKADIRADIRDASEMKRIFKECRPEIVFHLAAQPLVRLSYEIPSETWQVNVMGTVNVMEAMRATDSVRAAVMITTDKCYENKEQVKGYREDDPFGGHDPYSSSKGACEIAIQSWRRSFWSPETFGKGHRLSIASARAGNVIGGGDWAKDRIIPDCIRAIEAGVPVELRNPGSVRPWQHVLEPLYGYLLLAKKMWEAPSEYCEGWNFGPEDGNGITVEEVASALVRSMGKGELKHAPDARAPHEAGLLRLDITKAKERLGWRPRLDAARSVLLTADWYKRYRSEDVYGICTDEIRYYTDNE